MHNLRMEMDPSIVLRSLDLWIKGCVKIVKSRAFLLRRRACFPSPSARAPASQRTILSKNTSSSVDVINLRWRWSLEVRWCSKIGVMNQLLLTQLNRNRFLFTWVKSTCNSWLLFLSTHLTSKLHRRWRLITSTQSSVACVEVWLGVLVKWRARAYRGRRSL